MHSPDGTLVAAAGDDWTVGLWQVACDHPLAMTRSISVSLNVADPDG